MKFGGWTTDKAREGVSVKSREYRFWTETGCILASFIVKFELIWTFGLFVLKKKDRCVWSDAMRIRCRRRSGERSRWSLTPRSVQLSVIHQPHGEINETRVCGSMSAPRSCQFSQYGAQQLLLGCSGELGSESELTVEAIRHSFPTHVTQPHAVLLTC